MLGQIAAGRFDRQERAIGKEAMEKIISSKVLLLGLGGLGVEIAKNLMLMGVQNITVFDRTKPSWNHLTSQFFISEADVSKEHENQHKISNRFQASFEKLKKLNPYCVLDELILPQEESSSSKTNFNDSEPAILKYLCESEILSRFSCVVVSDSFSFKSFLAPLNTACRKFDVKFICACCRGLFGFIFNDFGSEFVVKDVNGEEPASGVIIQAEFERREGKKLVLSIDTKDRSEASLIADPHNLSDDSRVAFKKLEPKFLENLNGVAFPVKKINPFRFEIDQDLSKYFPNDFDLKKANQDMVTGYFCEQRKERTYKFSEISKILDNFWECEFLCYDFSKMGIESNILLCFLALESYLIAKKRYPCSYNQEDCKDFIQEAHRIHQNEGKTPFQFEIDQKMLQIFSFTCNSELNPLSSFFGGLVAQEIQKAMTGKFCPINPFFCFEAIDCLPSYLQNPSLFAHISAEKRQEEFSTEDYRYDSQISVFGKTFQKKLSNFRAFLVGAGALGCEFLKNFALMGAGCGPKGNIVVTDPDSIELSNLSRQFLFRDEHVGSMKSSVASIAAKDINPSLQVTAMHDKVCQDTEGADKPFNDKFYSSFDAFVTALDNVEARKYMDSKAVAYKKPLFDSGTLGPKAHAQVVLPYLTQTYSSTQDPPTKDYPKCTIHSFPNVIQHTIAWATELFGNYFTLSAQKMNIFLRNRENSSIFEKDAAETQLFLAESLHEKLIKQKPASFEDCLKLGRVQFDNLFDGMIQNVLEEHPPDSKTESGLPFWVKGKRCPTAISEFDINDEMSFNFVKFFAILLAKMYEIPIPSFADDKNSFANLIPSSLGHKTQKPSTTEKEVPLDPLQQQKLTLQHFQAMQSDLKNFLQQESSKLQAQEINFEKDDDLHMSFVTAASNLRARNYGIPEMDKYTTKGIAGNIIPAMITTTAAITGLVCLELYKLVASNLNFESHDPLSVQNEVSSDENWVESLTKSKNVSVFKNSFLNIGVPLVIMSEITPPDKTICANLFTEWDSIKIDAQRDITLEEFMNSLQIEASKIAESYIKQEKKWKNPDTGSFVYFHGVPQEDLKVVAKFEIMALCYKISELFSFPLSLSRPEIIENRKKTKMIRLVEVVSKETVSANSTTLNNFSVICNISVKISTTEKGEIASWPGIDNLPNVEYIFKKEVSAEEKKEALKRKLLSKKAKKST